MVQGEKMVTKLEFWDGLSSMNYQIVRLIIKTTVPAAAAA